MRSAGMIVNDMPGLLVHEIDLNSSPYMKEHRELLLPNVRLAFSHALDIQKFINVAYLGHAQAAGSWIPPSSGGGWSDPNLKPESFDLALASQLLDQADCRLGSDGVRYYKGAKMEYNVIFPQDEQGPGSRVFQIYQADLAKIGIIVHQQSVDNNAAYTLITGPDNKYRSFQIAQWSWTAEIDPDFMLSVLTTSQWGALADTGFTNPTYDKLYLEQGREMNAAKRRAIVWKMQEIIYKDKPYIPTVCSNWLEAFSPKWAGFVLSPRGSWNNLSMQTLLSIHRV
jgi:peptide/nickel transport system substrate-binding protein